MVTFGNRANRLNLSAIPEKQLIIIQFLFSYGWLSATMKIREIRNSFILARISVVWELIWKTHTDC